MGPVPGEPRGAWDASGDADAERASSAWERDAGTSHMRSELSLDQSRSNRRGRGANLLPAEVRSREHHIQHERGNNLREFKDFNLKAKARTWP